MTKSFAYTLYNHKQDYFLIHEWMTMNVLARTRPGSNLTFKYEMLRKDALEETYLSLNVG